MVGKAPLPHVQLRRGHPQIQQHAVQLRRAGLLEQPLAIVEVAVQRVEAWKLLQPGGGGIDSGPVPVNTVERGRAPG